MEPEAARKSGMKGEETLMTLITLKAAVALLLRSQPEVWLQVTDWSFVFIACCLLLQNLAVYNLPTRKDDTQTDVTIFRPGVDSGVYCVLLVPLAMLMEVLYVPEWQLSVNYIGGFSEVTFLLASGCGMLLLAPVQLRRSYGVRYLLLVITASVSLVLLRMNKNVGDTVPWIVGVVVVLYTLYSVPYLCPWSFTFGEMCVISHVCGVVVFRMVRWMVAYAFYEAPTEYTVESYMYVFISVLLVFLMLATALVLYWEWCDNIVPFILVYVACALMAIGILLLLTGHQPVLWLFWFVFEDHRRVSLLVWWCAVAVVTVISFALYTQHLSGQSDKTSKASTAARKAFHCVVLAVYVPGLVVDSHFLFLASVVAFAVLVILEVSRVISVEFLGIAVDNSFRVFVDDRDQGLVFLTHFYLLIGLSLPLWLTHKIVAGDARMFCGVIALGIGDTVACLFGMKYGHRKWPGTKKSLEGTSASIVAQLLFVVLALYSDWLEHASILDIAFSVVISSVFEALVSQIDNLVLPLFMVASLPFSIPY